VVTPLVSRKAFGCRDNTTRMGALGGLIVGWVAIFGVGAQQPASTFADRDVLETVLEQIQGRAGSPALDKGGPDSLPIKIVDQARPICRAKLTDSEMAWPLLCAEIRFACSRNPVMTHSRNGSERLAWTMLSGWSWFIPSKKETSIGVLYRP